MIDDRFELKPDDITIIQNGDSGIYEKSNFKIGDIVELCTTGTVAEIMQIDYIVDQFKFDFLVRDLEENTQILVNADGIKSKLNQKNSAQIHR